MDGIRKGACGYTEIAHTADWALEIWAPDLAGLLETAARGMYNLMGITLLGEKRVQQEIEIDSADSEGLLVAFLNELLYLAESGTAFDGFQLRLTGMHLSGKLAGARIEKQSKEVKAVTYHGLSVQARPGGLQATVVFDV